MGHPVLLFTNEWEQPAHSWEKKEKCGWITAISMLILKCTLYARKTSSDN